MSEEELERELEHFHVPNPLIITITRGRVFEEYKRELIDLVIGKQTLPLPPILSPSSLTKWEVDAAKAYAKGEGCEEFLASAEALPRGGGVGGGKRKKSKKRKSKRKSKRKPKRKKTKCNRR